MRKSYWITAGLSVAALVGAVIFGTLESAGGSTSNSVNVPPVFTVNQGAAGTSAWPVTGLLGISNFPATQQVAGTVKVSTPTPYYSSCATTSVSCTTSATTSDVVIDNVSTYILGQTGDEYVCQFSDASTGNQVYVPLTASPTPTVALGSFPTDTYVGNSSAHLLVKSGDSIEGSCSSPLSGTTLNEMHWTFSGEAVVS